MCGGGAVKFLTPDLRVLSIIPVPAPLPHYVLQPSFPISSFSRRGPLGGDPSIDAALAAGRCARSAGICCERLFIGA